MNKKIKVAACQMVTKLCDVEYNLKLAKHLIDEAFRQGAKWVVLPEFFTTGMGFHKDLWDSALPLEGAALKMMRNEAIQYNGYVGGSFIAIKGNDRYNTFILVFPDGSYATHNKDIPTFWENCYFREGNDDGIITTKEATVGVVLCWEFIRWQTAKRLKDKIDFVLGGSCWYTTHQQPILRQLFLKTHTENFRIMSNSFSRLARILGVPVIHAGQAGEVNASTPIIRIPYNSYYLGETQIVDGYGNILAHMKRKDGVGIITAEITPGRLSPSEPIAEGFWTENLPLLFKMNWGLLMFHGKWFYQRNKNRTTLDKTQKTYP